jgi:predicted nucleotidyltransferase
MNVNWPGLVLGTDDAGFVIKQASRALIQDEWWPPLERTIEAYKEQLGPALRSIYVRGSVAVGRAFRGLSDIDTFALIEQASISHDPDGAAPTWLRALNREVTREWPYVARVEAYVFPLPAIHMSRWLAATIKTQSACLHGEDLSGNIPGFKPGIGLMLESWDLPRNLAIANRLGASLNDRGSVQRIYYAATKRLIRSAFELVMEQANCYTRDLHPCCHIVSHYYPEKAAAISEALAFALAPSADDMRFGDLADQFGEWLYATICAVHGAKRIAQLLDARDSGGNYDSVDG